MHYHKRSAVYRFAQRSDYSACLCELPLDAMFRPLPADVAQLVEQRFRKP